MKLEITKFGELFNVETGTIENIVVLNKEIIISISSDDMKKLISNFSLNTNNISINTSSSLENIEEKDEHFYVAPENTSSEIYDEDTFLQG